MKILFIPLFLILGNCNSKTNFTPSGIDSVMRGKSDTIIGVNILPAEIAGANYIEKEYFVVVKSDTSSFSCVISKHKTNGRISIHYRYDPYGKLPTSLSSEDTAAIAEQEPIKKFNRKLAYNDQIRELKLLLNYASKDYDLSKLSNLRLDMLSIYGLSQSVTKQYNPIWRNVS